MKQSKVKKGTFLGRVSALLFIKHEEKIAHDYASYMYEITSFPTGSPYKL